MDSGTRRTEKRGPPDPPVGANAHVREVGSWLSSEPWEYGLIDEPECTNQLCKLAGAASYILGRIYVCNLYARKL